MFMHVSIEQLESHVWKSANILRGPVDAADFKTYIFPLLFFKRICDVWDEECQEIVDETGDEQLAQLLQSGSLLLQGDFLFSPRMLSLPAPVQPPKSSWVEVLRAQQSGKTPTVNH